MLRWLERTKNLCLFGILGLGWLMLPWLERTKNLWILGILGFGLITWMTLGLRDERKSGTRPWWTGLRYYWGEGLLGALFLGLALGGFRDQNRESKSHLQRFASEYGSRLLSCSNIEMAAIDEGNKTYAVWSDVKNLGDRNIDSVVVTLRVPVGWGAVPADEKFDPDNGEPVGGWQKEIDLSGSPKWRSSGENLDPGICKPGDILRVGAVVQVNSDDPKRRIFAPSQLQVVSIEPFFTTSK